MGPGQCPHARDPWSSAEGRRREGTQPRLTHGISSDQSTTGILCSHPQKDTPRPQKLINSILHFPLICWVVFFSLGKIYNKNIFHDTQWKAVLKMILQFLFPVLPLYRKNEVRVTGCRLNIWICLGGAAICLQQKEFSIQQRQKISHPDWRVFSKSNTLEHLRVS